jgi:acylphosphatase
MTHVAKRFFVSGVVQGVGFRFFTERAARRLGLSGYAKNLRDGRVEVYVMGAEADLLTMEKELRRGPDGAIVSDLKVEITVSDLRYVRRFSIERDH